MYLENLIIKLNYVLFHADTLSEKLVPLSPEGIGGWPPVRDKPAPGLVLKIKELDNPEINEEDSINDEVDEKDEEGDNEPEPSHNFEGEENVKFFE